MFFFSLESNIQLKIMSHINCTCCQKRLKRNKNLFFHVRTEKMVSKLNKAKPFILEKLKKTNNGQLVQINDFVHKTFSLMANYIIEKNPENINHNESHNETQNENSLINENNDINSNPNEISDTENICFEDDFNSIQNIQLDNTETSIINSQDRLAVYLSKGRSSHKYCFVCHAENSNKKLIRVKNDTRFDILAKTNIFIVEASRLCEDHLDEKGFIIESDLQKINPIEGKVNFDENSIKELIKYFIETKNNSQIFNQFSSSSSIEDNSLKIIGFTKEEFLYLASNLDEKLHLSNKRTKEQAFFVYLFWLRTGLTMEVFCLSFIVVLNSFVKKYFNYI